MKRKTSVISSVLILLGLAVFLPLPVDGQQESESSEEQRNAEEHPNQPEREVDPDDIRSRMKDYLEKHNDEFEIIEVPEPDARRLPFGEPPENMEDLFGEDFRKQLEEQLENWNREDFEGLFPDDQTLEDLMPEEMRDNLPPGLRELMEDNSAEDSSGNSSEGPDNGEDTVQAPDAFIGISPAPLNRQTRQILGIEEGQGIAIQNVVPDSPADKAGLRTHDILLKLDDTTITGVDHLRELMPSYSPGDTVQITFLREGERQTTELDLISRRDMMRNRSGRGPESERGSSREADRPSDQEGSRSPSIREKMKKFLRDMMEDKQRRSREETGEKQSPDRSEKHHLRREIRKKMRELRKKLGDMEMEGMREMMDDLRSRMESGDLPTEQLKKLREQIQDLDPDRLEVEGILEDIKEKITGEGQEEKEESRDRNSSRSYEDEATDEPYIGFRPAPDSAGEGIVVQNVVDDSPADRAGLQEGDVILEMNGTRIRNLNEGRQVYQNLEIGEQATLRIRRGDREKTARVEIVDRGVHRAKQADREDSMDSPSSSDHEEEDASNRSRFRDFQSLARMLEDRDRQYFAAIMDEEDNVIVKIPVDLEVLADASRMFVEPVYEEMQSPDGFTLSSAFTVLLEWIRNVIDRIQEQFRSGRNNASGFEPLHSFRTPPVRLDAMSHFEGMGAAAKFLNK